MNNKSQLDLRIVKSKKVLKESLLKLLQTRSLKEINIKEIVEGAGLTRPVFYAHFKSKEDLLFSSMDSVFFQMREELQSREENLKGLITSFYSLWEKNRSLLKHVFQIQDREKILNHLTGNMEMLLQEADLEFYKKLKKHPRFLYIFDFAAGGVYSLLKRWTEEEMNLSARELGQLTTDLFDGLISAA